MNVVVAPNTMLNTFVTMMKGMQEMLMLSHIYLTSFYQQLNSQVAKNIWSVKPCLLIFSEAGV